jgi:hypothetical protein
MTLILKLKVFDNPEKSTLTAMHITAKPIITFFSLHSNITVDKAKI